MNTVRLNIHCEPPFPESYDKDERCSYDQALISVRATCLENAQ